MTGAFRLILATFLSGIVSWLSTKHESWAFVESVGGIEVMQPVRHEQVMALPVNCNVSGLKRITCDPTQMNSGLVIRRIDVASSSADIWITVATCLAGDGGAAGGLHYADISSLSPGTYRVYYGNKGDMRHEVARVTIPRQS